MNKVSHDLENDHKIVLRLTDVMESMVDKGATNTLHFSSVINLIRNYADGYHHEKEEKIYFPYLMQKGYSEEHGPVAIMIDEHLQGRLFLKGIIDALELYNLGSPSALDEIYFNMMQYVDLLRIHIGKENNVLFIMADRSLSESDHETLLEAFDKVKKENYRPGQLDRFIRDIEELELMYN